jgi:hypothetical protein
MVIIMDYVVFIIYAACGKAFTFVVGHDRPGPPFGGRSGFHDCDRLAGSIKINHGRYQFYWAKWRVDREKRSVWVNATEARWGGGLCRC